MREELRVWFLGQERSPGEGDGNPLQCSYLENLGQRSLVGYSTCGPRELDTAEHTHTCTHREQSRELNVWIQPVHPRGNQSWILIGMTHAEAETPILWPHDVKNWLIGKDPDVGKDWRREEKGMTEDEMAGWHHRLDGRKFWVNSGSWWWTGRPGMLQSTGSQRAGHNWATELNWVCGWWDYVSDARAGCMNEGSNMVPTEGKG